jgi:probable F420-dependent oxidoreductase
VTTSPFAIKPFRFGVQLNGPLDGAAWVETAKRIEGLGYAVATMPDHFDGQLAPMPALQSVLDATTTLRAGALVFDNDYKHPVVLAKELATMDVLSAGRVEIGLGAGWMITDYERTGMPYDRPGVRVDRFAEGLAVIRGAMGDGAFSFEGEHYTISGYDGLPKPVQRPHPPIIIGGGGRRVLTIAAREADIVGVNCTLDSGVIGAEAIATMTERAVIDKVGIVAAAAIAVDRIDDIEMNIRTFFVSVTDDPDEAIGAIAGMIGVDGAMVEASPFALVGSPSGIADALIERRQRFGFSYIIVGADVLDSFAPVVARLAGS